MPSDSRFWDWIAARYARTPIPDEASYRRKLDMTRALLTPEARVFEFGCGTGTTALAHAPHAGHIHAVDISEAMLAIARGKAETAGVTNVTFEAAGIADVTAPPGSYDMVMAHSVLHLLPDRDGAIARAFALLKPGGHFVSSTICLSEGLWFLRPVLPLVRLAGYAPRVWFFTSDTLRRAVERAGFEVVEDWRPGPRKATFLIARKPWDAPQT